MSRDTFATAIISRSNSFAYSPGCMERARDAELLDLGLEGAAAEALWRARGRAFRF
jgi:hypothetical protein